MAGFASYDDIILALTTNAKGQRRDFSELSLGTTVAASAYDLWLATGTPPAGTFGTPLTGRAIDSTFAAGVKFANPTGPATLHLLSAGLGSTVSLGSVLIYDRLVEYPFTGTVTSGSWGAGPTIPARDANGAALGAGVMMMVESFSATARAAVTFTPTYTNSAGTGSRTSAAVLTAGTAIAGGLSNPTGSPLFWPLQSGDTGVRSVQSYTLSLSATAANMCLTLIRPLAMIPLMAANSYVERDLVLQTPNLPRIYDGSNLSFLLLANTTTSPVFGNLIAAEK